MDNETVLFDRIELVKTLAGLYDLEATTYISFSGGKDSCVLSKLIDLALPDNKIPRVYKNTGIEFPQMVKFVRSLQEHDDRIIILPPKKPIKRTLDIVGYPFKAKQHSHNVAIYQRHKEKCELYKKLIEENPRLLEDYDFIRDLPKGVKTFVKYYYDIRENANTTTLYTYNDCPKILKYQFTPDFNIRISDECCKEFKKTSFYEYEESSQRPNCFTGQRKAEGGNRANLKCISNARNGKHFNILAPVTDDWIEWFIKKYEIPLCELYLPPFNFERTGCMGCPFNLKLSHELQMLKEHAEETFNQCYILWKPVYDEYLKLSYRLKRNNNYEN